MTLLISGIKTKPFVKWAGGKRQIVHILKEYAPEKFETYIDPFVGGGALFFDLSPTKAIISDINSELINAYRVIKEQVEELIKDLKKHKNTPEYYYWIRSIKPENLNPVERASRFIYLNKTCYNGLYRENSEGQFNVPFGFYKNPKIVDEENLRAISKYLNEADITIENTDFREVCNYAKAGDFVYLDPPYYPIKENAFTKYTKYDFSKKDHIDLVEVFRELDKRGCYVMLSNSNTDFIKTLYKGYRILEISANRFINCKPEGRKKSKIELIIINYR